MNRPYFNDKAHEIISAILDDAEMYLVQSDQCLIHEASEFLALLYIKNL